MPGRESSISQQVVESPVLGSLKAHKSLVRRDNQTIRASHDITVNQLYSTGESRSKNRNAYMTVDGVKSWIPEPAEDQPLPVVVKPLTPPINIRDTFQSWIDDDFLKHKKSARDSHSIGTTPLVQRSPPTPETTPPRRVHKSAAVDTIITDISKNRMVDTSREHLASETDSFRTARENLSSDDDEPDNSPSLRASRQRWLRDTGLSRSGGIGLGLGLPPDEDDLLTPREISARQGSGKDYNFTRITSAGGSDSMSVADDTESQLTALRDTDERAPAASIQVNPPALRDQVQSRKEHGRIRGDESLEKVRDSESDQDEGASERLSWPLRTVGRKVEGGRGDVSKNRLSQASHASTVVEAVVIDSAPQRRRTLRHTGRINGDGFKEGHKPTASSGPASQHRLRSVRSPPAGLRQSYVSEPGARGARRFPDSRTERIQVAIIPDRRSSLQSSDHSSKHISTTFSLNSQQQSSRPRTAPEEATGYLDTLSHKHRTVSAPAQPQQPAKTGGLAEKTLSSPITTDSPPHDLSRSTSTMSGGLRTHYIPETPSSEGSFMLQPQDLNASRFMSAQRSHSGDWTASRPRSTLVTPFSLRSAHSSTPGTLEVNEAKAVNIYPHTNQSILVIQETADREGSFDGHPAAAVDDSGATHPKPLIPQQARGALPSGLGRHTIDSPLQNPRDAPHPPDLRILPPTPANAPSSSNDTVRISRKSRISSRLNHPISTLRRSVSARRHSEAVALPFTRSLSLRNSHLRRSPRTAIDPDNGLHPFWRPRSFWDRDDETDSESEFGNDGYLSPQRSASHSAPKRSVSLTRRLTGSIRQAATPHPRRASYSASGNNTRYTAHAYTTSDVLPKRSASLSKKLGESFRLPRPRPKRFSAGEWRHPTEYEFVQPDRNRSDEIPRQGYPVQFVGFRNLAERLERRRENREEGKREARRTWLKGRIGLVGPRDVTGFDIIHPSRKQTE